jgi:two-component system cell cycle response regulator
MLSNQRTTQNQVVPATSSVEALVVARGREQARGLVQFLKALGANVLLADHADTAFEETLIHLPDVVLIDTGVPPSGGVELCQRLKASERTHFVPAILVTPTADAMERRRALAAGVDAIFDPTTDQDERRLRLEALLRTHALHRRRERRQASHGEALAERRRWLDAFVHDAHNALGAVRSNLEFLATRARAAGKTSAGAVNETVRDVEIALAELGRDLRAVLDLDRIESGRTRLGEAVLAPGDLLAAARDELRETAAALDKSIDLVPLPDRAPAMVCGDVDLLLRALVHLGSSVLRRPRTARLVLKASTVEGMLGFVVAADPARPFLAGDGGTASDRSSSRRNSSVGAVAAAFARAVAEAHEGRLTTDEGRGGRIAHTLALPPANGSRRA